MTTPHDGTPGRPGGDDPMRPERDDDTSDFSQDLDWVPEADADPAGEGDWDGTPDAPPASEGAYEPLPEPTGRLRPKSQRAQAAAADSAHVAKLAAIEAVAEPEPENKPKHFLARTLVSILLIALALGAGYGVFSKLKALKEEPEKAEPEAVGQSARVISIERESHQSVISAYAQVTMPTRATTTARVSGEIIWQHPNLKEGAVLEGEAPELGEPMPDGTLKPLLIIDPEPYEIALQSVVAQKQEAIKAKAEAESAIAQIDTEIAALPVARANIEAQLELAREAVSVAKEALATSQASAEASQRSYESLDASLETAQETLKLAEQQLARLEKLAESGDATEDQLDAQRIAVRNQQAGVNIAKTALLNGETGVIEAQNRVVSAKSALVQSKTSVQSLRNQLSDLDEQRKLLEARKQSAQASVERAQASVERFDSAIADAELRIRHTAVYAPYPGARVRTVHARRGDYVNAGSPLFLSSGGSVLEIEVRIPAEKRFEVELGTLMHVRSRPEGEELTTAPLRITRMSPVLDVSSRTRTVYAELGPDAMRLERLLQPGEMVFVEVDGHQYQDVFRLPRSAEVENGFFLARPVEGDQEGSGVAFTSQRVGEDALDVIARTGEYVLVRNRARTQGSAGGLRNGDRVIVSNLDVMMEGLAIRPVESETLEAAANPSAAPGE